MFESKQKYMNANASQDWFTLFRRKGAYTTLKILQIAGNELVESEFFDILKSIDSYLNEFYRVKPDLLEFGLIDYSLNSKIEKVLRLTPKGVIAVDTLDGFEMFLISAESETRNIEERVQECL